MKTEKKEKSNNKTKSGVTCDFCGRKITDGKIVASAVGSTCCGDCAAGILQHLYVAKCPDGVDNPIAGLVVPTPDEIVRHLDQYVIGQEETKKTLAVAVYNHYRRIQSAMDPNLSKTDDDLGDVEIEKSNILMLGPTGSGKTLFAKTIAKMLDVPFAIADATTLTQAGYVGEDVENIVRYLWANAGRDVARTEMGICVVDEVDKIAAKKQNVNITRDVTGEGVQQSLLKILEGTTCRFTPEGGRKHPEVPLIEVDTKNILFICAGAFVGLDDIVNRRLGGVNSATGGRAVGFNSAVPETDEDERRKRNGLLDKVTTEDLIEFGMIPELVGRIPIVTATHELSEDDLVRVLTEPKNCLVKQYRKLLRMSGCELQFTDEALRKIAHAAIANKTGARGLRAIFEKAMKDVMFTAPRIAKEKSGHRVVIGDDDIHDVA